MKILVVIFGILILTISKKLFSLRKELFRLEKKLMSINLLEENQRLNMEIDNKQLQCFVESVNYMMDTYRDNLIIINQQKKELKEIITNLSHDLRTPLTSIHGYARLLNDENIDECSQKKYIKIIDRKTKEINKMVDELFEFSLIQNEDITILFEKVNIIEILADTIADFYKDIEESNLCTTIDISEKPLFILCDRTLLKRVFTNIIQNAIKYRKCRFCVNCTTENDDVIISIANDVDDISQDDLSKIFKRFYRLDYSRSTKGYGLGLNISKNLVEQMNGVLNVSLDNNVIKFNIIFKLLYI